VWWLGVDGAGVAFFASYLFHALLLYPVVRSLTGFRWSAANRRTGAVYLACIGAAFLACRFLPPWPAAVVGSAILVLNTAYSLRDLVRLVPPERLPARVRQALDRLQAARAGRGG